MNRMDNQDSWVLFSALARSELLRLCNSLKNLDSHFLTNFLRDFT